MADKPPSLTPDGHGTFIDERGVTWMSPLQWLFSGQMKGCGCGIAESVGEIAWELLRFYAGKCRDASVPVRSTSHEIVALWLEREGLTEHGSSVTYSWLTEKGQRVHDMMRSCETAQAEPAQGRPTGETASDASRDDAVSPPAQPREHQNFI